MALYVIGDLHLSTGCDKPMDVFGGRWENYTEKLREGFSTIRPEDTTVLCGDISWGMSLQEAREDFMFIHALPGRKIILKGNHDYWWTTVSQANRFLESNGIHSISFLNNNAFIYGDFALCGTRGWADDAGEDSDHDQRMLILFVDFRRRHVKPVLQFSDQAFDDHPLFFQAVHPGCVKAECYCQDLHFRR